MPWYLFLDDERYPDCGDWIIARSMDQAIECCECMGCPNFISFDHDLGETNRTGKMFANWLVDKDINSRQSFIPVCFDFSVHSQNPVGANNIKLYLNQYLLRRFGIFS